MSKNRPENSKWQREDTETNIMQTSEISETPITENVEPKGFDSYSVKVLAPYLNVRKGPNRSETAVSVLKRGDVHKIIDEKFGFGKLSFGAGWISLNADLVKKL